MISIVTIMKPSTGVRTPSLHGIGLQTRSLRAVSLLAILILAAFAAADEVPLSLADYKLRLERYSSHIQQTAGHPEYADDFYRDVPSSFSVQAPSGIISVPMDFLHQGLTVFLKATPGSKPAILSGLADRIRQMRAEADSFDEAHAGDPAARERLNQILAAREFGRVHGPTEWELLKDRINAWLNEKMKKISPRMPDIDQLGQIFVWIVIALVSSMLIVWLYRLSRERLLDQPREIVPFVPSARSWRSWLAEARENAAHGQWRDAIRLGFWAAVSRLESDGVWRPDKARTPREYLNAIPAVSENKPPFAAVTKTFEVAWYGSRPTSASDFERFLAELEKLGCQGR
jgi:Domain of unknown function (DUF4129)